MTTRQQTLRSSTTGATPAAGARLPGELFVNFPDLQLGTIDASKNAQRLIAVRFFSTTANYAIGDYVVQASQLYQAKVAITASAFSLAQWDKVMDAADVTAALAPYLPLAGGTLTGLLTLSGPPTNPLHAATKAYADGVSAGLYLPLAGGTLTGPLTGTSATFNSVLLNAAAGTNRAIWGQSGGSNRWGVYLGVNTAESGSNAGSDFQIAAYNDAGALLSTPLSITRATGVVNINGVGAAPSAGVPSAGSVNFYLNKASATASVNVIGTMNGSNRWTVALGNNTAESGSNAGSDLAINRYSDAGAFIDVPLTIARTSGIATFAAGLKITTGGIYCKPGVGGALITNQFTINWTSVAQLWIDNANLGTITVTSDYRTKKDVAGLPSMWDRVKALRPISYTHKDFTPPVALQKGADAKPMIVADDIERWGFVAHELQETLIPSAATGEKDSPDHIQSPNWPTLVATLTKALQEAMARIEAIEAGAR